MTPYHLVQTLGWWTPVEVAGFLVAGFALGFAHFAALWHHARELVEGGRWWRTAALAAGRFSLLIAALTLASFQGAAALLAMTLGLLFGRAIVMRRSGRIET
ncbi:ATP synthase subunit I [Aurantimonas sp. VKM B-3413]|uniref:N-ATPase subunit AtpR n=1 Tax=Aurantimonas sp. VKM B-3413 TaxID=2779401 RepID=UPI001E2FFDA1|nr:ATP synthase subunit I [Aurantimonas sp. VKM B-3413]MCB8839882.1 ATP synthase subunit I [Aurantimonas sp. VKM B-3413]